MRHCHTLLSIGLCLAAVLPAKAQVALQPILEDARQKHTLSAMGAISIIDGEIGQPQVVGVIGRGMPKVIQPDARWHLGSCGKSMTAMLAAVMIEQGELDWELTLGEALKDTDIQVDQGYQNVTLRQLLSHRGGLPGDLMSRPIWGQLRMQGGPALNQRRQITQVYLGDAPAYPAGSQFKYANEGYVIVGHILELVGGKPYEELMVEQVFKPLGLTSAGFGPPPGESDPRGHKWNVPMPPHRLSDNPEGLSPAGRIHMSLSDWARFAQVHLQAARGERYELINEDSYRRLHTPAQGEFYALGWGRSSAEWSDGPALTHSGSNTMWRAKIWIAPNRNAAILVTTNNGTSRAKTAIREVIQTISDGHWPSTEAAKARRMGHVPANTLEAGFTLHLTDTTGLASTASPIFVVSNHNGWNPNDPDWRMSLEDGVWTLRLPQTHHDQSMHFKFTRGSWETVELGAQLQDMPNRHTQYVDPESTSVVIKLKTAAFADQRP